ncbi:unnamed protein product [Linum tenue]|uniref:Uncharacterized protein n=1 Tax=Linum tenue TaxID=586396 RepID=A0AAV0NT02_9ROSI|nr:unnamed protein product [Linum tenue]
MWKILWTMGGRWMVSSTISISLYEWLLFPPCSPFLIAFPMGPFVKIYVGYVIGLSPLYAYVGRVGFGLRDCRGFSLPNRTRLVLLWM